MKNKKGFTLVELLAVIVVLGIVMGIAAFAITNVLDSTRKNAFVASAKQFVDGAKLLVDADIPDTITVGSGKYLESCNGTYAIPIGDIKTKSGNTDKTPWGLGYDKTNSKVFVTVSDSCETFSYKIYLTESGNAHYIANEADKTDPVSEANLSSDYVFPQ